MVVTVILLVFSRQLTKTDNGDNGGETGWLAEACFVFQGVINEFEGGKQRKTSKFCKKEMQQNEETQTLFRPLEKLI